MEKESDNIPEVIPLDEKYEECRIDPYNEKWYTKSEFNNYYKGYIEWDFQEPKKVLIRQKIGEVIISLFSYFNNMKKHFIKIL